MDNTGLVQRARDAGVQLVSFLYCDNGGVIRGKSSHITGLEGRLDSGIGLTVAMQAMTDMDQLQLVDGMGPVGEVRLVPDRDTFTILPYASKRALMLSDLITLERLPWDACPRDFLKRMIARAESMGLTIQAALEPEWYLAQKEGDAFVPCDESLCNASIGHTFTQPVIDDVVEALESQGLQVEQYYPELGHGQHEMSIRHADALRAADNHLVYRETVRNVAWQHGYYASFAPKPYPNQPGNGCHIHFSAWDRDGERNLFFDPAGVHNLSTLAFQFMAGVLEHLPALVALTCPSMNSYRRLAPGSWSSAFACYGPDNREAAVRVPSLFWGEEMASANLELKASDSSANPYIALGGLIAAGLDGIERGLHPADGLRVDVDPGRLTPEELASRGIQRLPTSLKEAANNLESDAALTGAMGPALANSYLVVRRADWELFSQRDAEFEIKNHFYKY